MVLKIDEVGHKVSLGKLFEEEILVEKFGIIFLEVYNF